MPTYSKEKLSQSTQGRPIQISATASIGTTIHTTNTSSTTLDEVWIYATNNDTVQRTLTIQYGNTGSASEITAGIPSRSGLSIVLPGTVLSGDGSTGSIIRGYSNVTNQINVVGYVNRIIP